MGLGAQGQNANSGNRGSSWRYEFDVLRVLNEIAAIRTIRVDDTGAPAISYVGEADPGSLETESAWRIKKIITAGALTTILFANGNSSFNNIWTNRASLTYS